MNGSGEALESPIAIEAIVWAAGLTPGPLIGGYFVNHSGWRGAFWFFGLQAVVSPRLIAGVTARCSARRRASAVARRTLGISFRGDFDYCARRHGGRSSDGDGRMLGRRRSAVCCRPIRRPVTRSTIAVETSGISASCRSRTLDGACALDVDNRLLVGTDRCFSKFLFGTNPLIAGYILAAEGLAWSLATMVVSRIDRLSDILLIRIGVAAICVGASCFAVAVPAGMMSGIVACALLQGLGFGICWPAIAHRLVLFASSPAERSLGVGITIDDSTNWLRRGDGSRWYCSECIRT